jgi:hypothetical protein
MKLETLNSIINAFHAASDDTTRYALGHVRIESDGVAKLRIVATEGHYLAVVNAEDEEAAKTMGKWNYHVSPDQLALLKAVAKAWKHGIPMLAQDKAVMLGGNGVTVTLSADPTFEYPDYNIVIPKNMPDDAVSFSFSAEYLHSLWKALGGNARRGNLEGITLTVKDSLSPIMVKVGDQTGVLMPRRMGAPAKGERFIRKVPASHLQAV